MGVAILCLDCDFIALKSRHGLLRLGLIHDNTDRSLIYPDGISFLTMLNVKCHPRSQGPLAFKPHSAN